MAERRGVHLLPEVCALPIRRAPDQGGRCLFSPGLHGFGLRGSKNWILANGLGLSELGSDFECFGLGPKASDLSNSLCKSFGFSCIRNSHFLIVGLSLRASNRECLHPCFKMVSEF